MGFQHSRTSRAVAALAIGAGVFGALVGSPLAISQARPVTAGAVYTISNDAIHNQVVTYQRNADGTLAPAGSFDTGGAGTGNPLGTQGALALSEDGRYLVAVNAGSDSVSLLAVHPDGLELLDTAPAQGITPIGVTVNDDVVYVVNDGSDSIAGFRIEHDSLAPIANSVQALPAASAPGQIGFTQDGRELVVTVKNLSEIVTFDVDGEGAASAGVAAPSAGATPFGFAIDREGRAIVSEAANSDLSSYQVNHVGPVTLIDGPVANGGAAACWVALSKDGHFAFSANADSATISTYRIEDDGGLTLVSSAAGQPVGGPLDLAVSNDGKYLYAESHATNAISEFAIAKDGSLTFLGSVSSPKLAVAGGLVAK